MRESTEPGNCISESVRSRSWLPALQNARCSIPRRFSFSPRTQTCIFPGTAPSSASPTACPVLVLCLPVSPSLSMLIQDLRLVRRTYCLTELVQQGDRPAPSPTP
ncbi:hypothetical protein BDW62DRAFT_100852 [Aspergillus aurantiobrunneus]